MIRKMIDAVATIRLTPCEVERPVARRKSEQIAARIVADEFDRKSDDRIDDAVNDEYLAVKFFMAVQVKQKRQKRRA